MSGHRDVDDIFAKYFSTVTPEGFKQDLAEFSPGSPAEPAATEATAKAVTGRGQPVNVDAHTLGMQETRLDALQEEVRDVVQRLSALERGREPVERTRTAQNEPSQTSIRSPREMSNVNTVFDVAPRRESANIRTADERKIGETKQERVM